MKRTALRPRKKRPMVANLCADGILVYRDGREVCLFGGDAIGRKGTAEYKRRNAEMQERQENICCLFGYSPVCHPRGLLLGYRATFDHEHGRGIGGGKRDDRTVLPDGSWQNGSAHLECNNWKGSRFIDYNAAHKSVTACD